MSILLYIIGRYSSIITKSSASGTISSFKMTTAEMNIILQPGQQSWPGLAWYRPGQKFQNSAWPGRPLGAFQAPGQAGSSDLEA
jgi:hypothetical protein